MVYFINLNIGKITEICMKEHPHAQVAFHCLFFIFFSFSRCPDAGFLPDEGRIQIVFAHQQYTGEKGPPGDPGFEIIMLCCKDPCP